MVPGSRLRQHVPAAAGKQRVGRRHDDRPGGAIGAEIGRGRLHELDHGEGHAWIPQADRVQVKKKRRAHRLVRVSGHQVQRSGEHNQHRPLLPPATGFDIRIVLRPEDTRPTRPHNGLFGSARRLSGYIDERQEGGDLCYYRGSRFSASRVHWHK